MPRTPLTSRRRDAIGAAVAMLVVLSTACGGSDTATTAPTAASTTAPAATGGTTQPASPTTATTAAAFALSSSAFAEGAEIPVAHACAPQGGKGTSPPLAWTGVPAPATTLVLVVHDPDALPPRGFTHLVTSFPATTTSFADAANQTDGPMQKWLGPCPPSGTHHYEFTLYAFGSDTTVPTDADKAAIDAIAGKALASTKLVGLFTKK